MEKNLYSEIMKDSTYNIFEIPLFSRIRHREAYFENMNEFEKEKTVKIFNSDLLIFFSEFDEKIFFSILSIAKKNKSDVFYTDAMEIIETAGVNYNGDTLKKMKNTLKKFEASKIFFEGINVQCNEKFFNKIAIIKMLEEIDRETAEVLGIKLRSNKLKKLIKIKIDFDIFNDYQTLENGFYFSIKNLLARRLYVLINVWSRNSPKTLLAKKIIDIAALLPLNYEINNLKMSRNYILEALDYLYFYKIIENYKTNNDADILKSNFEIILNNINYEERISQINEKAREKIQCKRISFGNYRFMNEKDLAVLKNEIKEILANIIEILKQIAELNKSIKIEKQTASREVVILIIEKFHAVKGLAEFIEYYEVSEMAFEYEKYFDTIIHSGKNIFSKIGQPTIDGCIKMAALIEIRRLEKEHRIVGLNRCKIVMTTALHDSHNIKTAFLEQADGYITKPILKNKVIQFLRKIDNEKK